MAGAPVDLCEFVFGASQADLKPFDLAEPAFTFGLGDAGVEVVADLQQPVLLVGVRPKERAPDAGVFVHASAGEGSATGADGDLAALEVAEELLPFFIAGCAIFIGGPLVTAAGQKCQMGLDSFVGVDGLVAHGDVDVAVPGDDLGDVRW